MRKKNCGWGKFEDLLNTKEKLHKAIIELGKYNYRAVPPYKSKGNKY